VQSSCILLQWQNADEFVLISYGLMKQSTTRGRGESSFLLCGREIDGVNYRLPPTISIMLKRRYSNTSWHS
jgi:hypothetical protein